VGSLRATGEFHPLPTISPAIATTAPTGTSPASAPVRANRSASRMNCSSMAEMPAPREHHGHAQPVGRRHHFRIANRPPG